MPHFDDVILPDSIALGSSTGPSTSTQVVHLASGFRKANQLWSQHLRRFPIGYNLRAPEDAHVILSIFEAVDGPANSFLLRDWNDWNTTAGFMEAKGAAKITAFDQPLQNTTDNSFLGDGSTTVFQMVKRYVRGATAAHTREIQKPQTGTIKVAVDGIAQAEGVDFTVDYATGKVTFTAAPGASVSPTAVAVTWGGAFHVPVAFTSDDFLQELATFDGAAIPSLELMEVRL